MTTKETFKTYYLPWLIGIGILFGFKFGLALFDEEKRERVTSPDGLVLLFGLIIVIGFFSGGLFHWFFAVYRPKRLAKLFNRIKDLDLHELGLKVDLEQRNFSGYYKGYYLTIFADSSPNDGDWVMTNVFFNRKDSQEELYTRLQKRFELNTDNELFWFTSKTKMRFGKNPRKEKLTADINDLVDALRYERVEPSTSQLTNVVNSVSKGN
jgi:hypothetical protein